MLEQASNASTVLTWVRRDLDKHLTQIRTQIEHIATSSHIGDGVTNTKQHLRQLKYTFEALVLQGATLVFEEMIRVCDELEHFNDHDRQIAFAALMDAIVIVPSYLDRLQAGHHDLPVLLLPVINELRSAYNASVVSEATLFAPNLDVPLPELEEELTGSNAGSDTDPTDNDESFQSFARRLRRQYENALLSWLQNQNDISLLSPLHKVCETTYRRAQRLDIVRLWWIAAEVIVGLLDGVIDNDVHIHRLFARLNIILKSLAEKGETATSRDSTNAISQALLFHVAQSRSGNASVDLLRERFQLKTLVPDREALLRARGTVTGRNRDLYNALGAAVRDELSLIKDALDLELRTGVVDVDRRSESKEALRRLKDTLKMMGLGDSARSIDELLPSFEASEDANDETGEGPRNTLLLELAERLIQVESVLEEQIETLGEPLELIPGQKFIDLPTHELHRFRVCLLDETVVSMRQLQEGVHQHFGGNEDADFTSPLEHIAGAMELIGDIDSAKLALQLRNALDNLLSPVSSEVAIDSGQLERVTDAVAAFELYLAGCRDQQGNRGQFLEILKDRLGHLPVAEMEKSVRPVAPAPQAQKPPAPGAAEPGDGATGGGLPQGPDQELLEVFLEEYESVAGMLRKQIPRWLEQPENNKLMTEIRRGFHTLKGSGRMVGAIEMGDFSWHIEEMLNMLLAGRTGALDDVGVIVQLAAMALPELKLRLLQQPSDLSTAAIEVISRNASQVVNGSAPAWREFDGLLSPEMHAVLPAAAVDTTDGQVPVTETTGEGTDDETDLDDLLCKELASNLAVFKGLMNSVSRDRKTTASDAQLLAIHTIAGTMALQAVGHEDDVAKALEGLLEAQKQSRKPFSDTAVWTIATSLEHLQACLSRREGDEGAVLAEDEDELIEQLLALGFSYETPVDDEVETHLEVPGELAGEPVEPVAPETSQPKEPASDEEIKEFEPVEVPQEDPVDTEILAIFLEEAVEVLARSDTLLNTWRDDLPNLEVVKNTAARNTHIQGWRAYVRCERNGQPEPRDGITTGTHCQQTATAIGVRHRSARTGLRPSQCLGGPGCQGSNTTGRYSIETV